MESRSHKTPNMPQGYVRLDVGGSFYTTSLSSLTRYPNPMLYSMFTQENIPLAQDKEGRYIIDRDGSVFRYILNFLRGGNLNLPPGFIEYDQLQEEVDFYQLDEMKELLYLSKVVNLKGAYCDSLSGFTFTSSLVKMNVGDKEFYFKSNFLSQNPSLSEKLRRATQDPVAVRRGQHGFRDNRLRDGTVDCDPTSFQYILTFFNENKTMHSQESSRTGKS